MISGARYVHTNLIARDWRALARFYQEVFCCEPVPPARRLSGPELAAGTGLRGAALEGAHLRLPGHGPDGPTLEIFEYADSERAGPAAVNRPGFAHIAFSVRDVEAARKEVLDWGGKPVGEIVTIAVGPGSEVTWCYVTDPEGNIVELQSWSSQFPLPDTSF